MRACGAPTGKEKCMTREEYERQRRKARRVGYAIAGILAALLLVCLLRLAQQAIFFGAEAVDKVGKGEENAPLLSPIATEMGTIATEDVSWSLETEGVPVEKTAEELANE